MKDSILKNVIYEKDGSCWFIITIQRLKDNGRCATSEIEPIGKNDLYYYDGEIYPSSDVKPPKGSLKMIITHYWFHKISTLVGRKLLIECEQVPETSHYKMKYPLNIKLKGNQIKRIKRLEKLAKLKKKLYIE